MLPSVTQARRRTVLRSISDHYPAFVPSGLTGNVHVPAHIVRFLAPWTCHLIPPPEGPIYIAEENVRIVVSTVNTDEEFREAAHLWLVAKHKQYRSSSSSRREILGSLQDLVNAVDSERILVLPMSYSNKWTQMSLGVKNTMTDTIIFMDDDAI
ncbi:glycosyltransferase family 2 protein [Gelatoporia subvermispora B]|uniref:Glycosyltransferase family 2 protein n=1 Tax=Ceriporiopsis subvermispora (strain B) TaxID=914234 RepID=M2Q1I0_CERS8|nr:glycosyltransferase family 2 protein [Gelatoporia subvermispora B]